MYVKQENSRDFYLKTEGNYMTRGYKTKISESTVNDYLDFLDTIAKESQYSEGEKISKSDLEKIGNKVNHILKNLRDEMVEKESKMAKGVRANSDCYSAMLETTDYLFAMTMDTLGCPDMPASFGPSVQKNIVALAEPAEFLIKKEDYEKITTADHHAKQRKRSADFVRSNNSSRMDFIKTKKGTALHVANLAAEYQALKQRQDNHTGIWRFFHGKENDARVALLGEMREALKFAVGNEVDIDSKSPLEIAKAFNNRSIESSTKIAFRDQGIISRQNLDKDAFVCEAADNKRTTEEVENSKEKGALNGEKEFRAQMKIDKSEVEAGKDKLDFSSRVVEGAKEKELTFGEIKN